MQKEDFGIVVVDRIHNSIVDLSLSMIEQFNIGCNSLSQLLSVVVELFIQKSVSVDYYCPISNNMWHICNIDQLCTPFAKNVINQVKTIVIDFILSEIMIGIDVLKLVQQIVTDVVFEIIPKIGRRCRIAVMENSSKEMSEYIASLHFSSLSETLSPFMIILQ